LSDDRFRYYSIGHAHHKFMNPANQTTLSELGWACGLVPRKHAPQIDSLLSRMNLGQFPGSAVARAERPVIRSVLDVGCGKGAVSFLFAENFFARCTGVDVSSGEIHQAQMRKRASARRNMLSFVLADGKEYVEEQREQGRSYDVLMCLGATFIFGDTENTLDALLPCLAPGGALAVGEVTLNQVPGAEQYAEQAREHGLLARRDEEVIEMADRRALDITYVIESSRHDWDRYESLQWTALYEYARSNPRMCEALEFFSRKGKEKREYFARERKYLGWKIFVLRPKQF